MKKINSNAKLVLLGMILLLAFSCSTDRENPIVQEQTISSTEVVTILDIDSQSRVVDDVITDLFENGQSGKSSKREDCILTEYSDTGFTATFDNCSVDGSENINGSLSVTYKLGAEESAFTATYTNVSVGDIVINGSRDFAINQGSEGSSVTIDILSDISIELADGSTIEESGSKNLVLAIDALNFANSTLKIDGNWTVTTDGTTYVVSITSPLVTTILSCHYVSTGVMSIIKNGQEGTVDFGDGTCDAIVTLTHPNGTTEEISLKD